MATLKQIATKATKDIDPEVELQICAGLVVVALEVMNEAPATADHAKRLELAQSIMSNPGTGLLTQRWRWAIVAQGLLDTTPTDANLLTALRNVWTLM